MGGFTHRRSLSNIEEEPYVELSPKRAENESPRINKRIEADI